MRGGIGSILRMTIGSEGMNHQLRRHFSAVLPHLAPDY
jgi:hypothetical protein